MSGGDHVQADGAAATREAAPKRVVIVGGGFGGLRAARRLARSGLQLTLIDKRNHHLFQPLLYQVATAGLGPDEIAMPIRSLFRRNDNVEVLLGAVRSVDLQDRRVLLADGAAITYDYLVMAAGAVPNYFGQDDWRRFAPSLKDLDTALCMRERVLFAFEAAEREPDPDERKRLLTVVVIGGGPTGVELAGALSELTRLAMAREYRRVHREDISVVLVEMAPRLLPGGFDPKLSERAQRMLEEIGVEVRVGTRVEDVTSDAVHTAAGPIHAATVLWASGVKASPLGAHLGEVDRQGRVVVTQDCSLPGHPEVFVIGDMASFTPPGEARALPALAPVAIQQGATVARNIRRDLEGQPRQPFHYRDKGLLATIGRSRAVAQVGRMKTAGLFAWLLWTVVHIFYLIGFRTRVLVLMDWTWRYVTHRPGARLITEREATRAATPPSALRLAPRGEETPSPEAAGDKGERRRPTEISP